MNSTLLAQTILRYRKAAGLTQKQLAEYAGIGKTAVFDIEQGKITVRFTTILKILDVLNIEFKLEGKLDAKS